MAVELVALEPDEAPDWEEARRYIDALSSTRSTTTCSSSAALTRRPPGGRRGSRPSRRVSARISTSFSADVERDHDEIEEWDFHDGRVFASVGSIDDESDPDRGHGWMCRLLDAGALGAAGFSRVRKLELEGLH